MQVVFSKLVIDLMTYYEVSIYLKYYALHSLSQIMKIWRKVNGSENLYDG